MSTLPLYSEPLQNAWLDAYGHLNEAYYLVPFSNATWAMQAHFGIGVAYFEHTGCALYTVETHIRYLKEVRPASTAPYNLEIETIIIKVDAKRIWFAHLMKFENELCATAEFMVLHYDTQKNCVMHLPEAIQQALQVATIPNRPQWVSGSIALPSAAKA